MTAKITIQNMSNVALKVSTVETEQEGKPTSERLIMNREPQEFVITKDRMLVIAEADTADEGDNKKAAALDAAAKEPQRLGEQRNPQVTLGSQPHDPNKEEVDRPTPMANTNVEQIPAQRGAPETAGKAVPGETPPAGTPKKAPEADQKSPATKEPPKSTAPMTNKDKAP
jgi:hypothetical protein